MTKDLSSQQKIFNVFLIANIIITILLITTSYSNRFLVYDEPALNALNDVFEGSGLRVVYSLPNDAYLSLVFGLFSTFFLPYFLWNRKNWAKVAFIISYLISFILYYNAFAYTVDYGIGGLDMLQDIALFFENGILLMLLFFSKNVGFSNSSS